MKCVLLTKPLMTSSDRLDSSLQKLYNNGIVANESEISLSQKPQIFFGLSITSEDIKPSPKIMATIKIFSGPNDISNA